MYKGVYLTRITRSIATHSITSRIHSFPLTPHRCCCCCSHCCSFFRRSRSGSMPTGPTALTNILAQIETTRLVVGAETLVALL